MRKIFIISATLFLCLGSGFSQQLPVYSQYVLNEFLINPSVAGIDGMTTVNFSGRKQWIGIQNTPETYSACVSTRILKSPFSIHRRKMRKSSKGRVGLGAAFVSDRNGAVGRTNFRIIYAYHIFFRDNQLSFGLEANTTQFQIDRSLIEFRDPDAPEVENMLDRSTYIPDAAVGINYSTPMAHIGFSANQLFQANIKIGNYRIRDTKLIHTRHYNLYGFHRIKLQKEQWELEPSILYSTNFRFSKNSSYKPYHRLDISSRIIYNKEYWAGLSFRTSRELILLLGLKVKRLYFGYSFDYGFNQFSRLSWGSHEVYIAIKFGDSIRRYRWFERY